MNSTLQSNGSKEQGGEGAMVVGLQRWWRALGETARGRWCWGEDPEEKADAWNGGGEAVSALPQRLPCGMPGKGVSRPGGLCC